ncbi:hypothetical protein ASD79_08910 [Caulobacter sp. Root655]|uniref:hypothetical protein n=1 Tax=Caulobacter sp. Root655 TaxID=1736578 RepID=UPI0006FE20DF|nr:hypothetical protein [Caulobacter sp. Root655]KRA60344.1 hypothetical protein ASD79_08910 [Caulobacter sp. Root655]
MSDTDTLCFANADGVTGNPTIDGFFFTDAGVLTTEAEPGYVGGSRMTFGGAGFPPVVFQGVRDTGTGTLVFAFLCRLDRTFDPRDVVVLALRPAAGAGDQARRRIDIFPSFLDVGADDPGPAGDPDDIPPGVPMGADYHVRGNHVPQAINFYRADNSAAPWTAYSPVTPGAYEVKVRTWLPPVAMGSPDESAWSIEIRVPVSTATGGADWINLSPAGFGLYFSVVRIGQDVAAGPDVVDDYYATQFRFPVVPGNALTGFLDTTLQINPSWYGTGLIPALQVPAESNLGLGVRFVDGALGVGCRKPSTGATLSHEISGTENNHLVAILQNTGTSDANNVTAEVRLANWGLGSPGFTDWARPPGLAPNPSASITVPAGGGAVETHSDWLAGTIPAAYAAHKHQCIWVQLSSSSAVNFAQSSVRRNMDFINLSEVERPAEVSGVGYPPPKDGGKTHDFLLFTHVRKIRVRDLMGKGAVLGDEMLAFAAGALQQPGPLPVPNLEMASIAVGDQREWRDTVLYLWITEGYRRTGQTLTIGKITAEVLDEGPGAFGYVARHEGIDDPFSWSFEGPGLTRRRPGVHGLKVPHDGVTTLNVKLKADKDGPRGDVSTDPPAKGPGIGGPDGGSVSSGDGPTAATVENWVKRNFKWWWLLILLIILLLILLMR